MLWWRIAKTISPTTCRACRPTSTAIPHYHYAYIHLCAGLAGSFAVSPYRTVGEVHLSAEVGRPRRVTRTRKRSPLTGCSAGSPTSGGDLGIRFASESTLARTPSLTGHHSASATSLLVQFGTREKYEVHRSFAEATNCPLVPTFSDCIHKGRVRPDQLHCTSTHSYPRFAPDARAPKSGSADRWMAHLVSHYFVRFFDGAAS
jgi:hypothetical protein